MLLRRITEHVRAQNWTAVFLDFIIVIAGILIAFQITNWNDARGERARETQILRDIANDIASDIDMYRTSIESALTRLSTIDYILEQAPNAAIGKPMATLGQPSLGQTLPDYIEEAAHSGSHIEDFEFEIHKPRVKQSLWSSAIIFGNFQRNTNALNALINSGDLSILSDKSIVEKLQEYQHIASAIEKSQDVTFRPARDAAIAIGHKFGLSAFGTVDEAAFIELVRTNPELAASIQSQKGWATGHYLMLAAADQVAQALLLSIRTSLGEDSGNRYMSTQ